EVVDPVLAALPCPPRPQCAHGLRRPFPVDAVRAGAGAAVHLCMDDVDGVPHHGDFRPGRGLDHGDAGRGPDQPALPPVERDPARGALAVGDVVIDVDDVAGCAAVTAVVDVDVLPDVLIEVMDVCGHDCSPRRFGRSPACC